MTGSAEIEIARKLFAAWSSGDADAPAPYLTEDAVLYDVVEGGEKRGWNEIRGFFAAGLSVWPDLVLAPQEFWSNERGVALTWQMSATVTNDIFGPEARGRKWLSDGMSSLEFRGSQVCREVDYHHGGAALRSLGLERKR